jgi:hypothetical protein
VTRPTDWDAVFGISDPTPGDPWSIRGMQRSWSDLADDAEHAESKVRQLLGDEAISGWIGEGGNAFRDKTYDLPDQLGKCHRSYRLAADALSTWASRLETHQSAADRALVQGREAKADLDSADASVSSASGSSVLGFVERYLDAGVTPPASVQVPTDQQIRDARTRLSTAQSAQHGAQSRLDGARQLALDAGSLRESDGRTAAAKIREASDAGIPERSRWDKFKDWAADAWHIIVEICKIVVLVLGIVALIIGGPLAWVVFAAALLVLADTIMKYLKGEASLWDVALAALACIPCTKGLTTLSELSAAFRSGGMLGAGAHILSAGRTALVEMAQSLRSLGPALMDRIAGLRGLEDAGGLADNLAALHAFDDVPMAPQGTWRGLDDAGLEPWVDEVVSLHPELSPDGVRGIWDYTTDAGYTGMNNAMRFPGGAADTPAMQERIADTIKGLSDLPSFEGTTFRGTNLPQSVVDGMETTGKFSDAAFSSSSLDVDVAHGFYSLARDNPTLFTISGTSGVNVQPFSAARGEAEILFQGGADFQVRINVVDPATGVRHVLLEEVR